MITSFTPEVNVSNVSPTIQETITFSAKVEEETQVFLGYRNSALTAPFTKVEMFDDGTHNDGVANDGVYGVDVTLTGTTTEYFIYAENDNIGMFSPRRAEFEFYTLSASFSSNENIVINEFMASNNATVTDQDGEFEDWIELYNKGPQSVDLSGYFLTDDATDLKQWTFPDGTSIEPDDYLIIWADDDEDQEGLHANFKLSGSGESIIISTPGDTSIVDAIDYTEQTTDVSFARIPNGTGSFQSAVSTFSANNDSAIDCSGAGGDMDNDGICADDDCDDGDASIGGFQAEGTACDDGDATTQNDVILADGCSCEGTLVEIGDVVINEFMASNEITVADQDGEFEDWIELYNNGTQAVDLSGHYLTDDATDLTKWAFPDGTTIAANGYLIIWADEDGDQAGLHADFKLSASGESVLLVSPDLSTIDALDYPEQDTDVSYGRFPNGTGPFQRMVPTFNAQNSDTSSTDDTTHQNASIRVYPNPSEDRFYLEYSANSVEEKLVTIFNTTGQIIYQERVLNKTQINTTDWTSGLYLISSEGTIIKLMVD